MGSIFDKWRTKVTLTSTEGNTLDNVVNGIKNVGREVLIHRKADEAFVYGEEAEDNEDVDMDEVPEKEDE